MKQLIKGLAVKIRVIVLLNKKVLSEKEKKHHCKIHTYTLKIYFNE